MNEILALGDLPRITNGLGGYDIRLGYAHKAALDIAAEIAIELNKEERKSLLDDVLKIFFRWKEEHGQLEKLPTVALSLARALGLKEENLTEDEKRDRFIRLKPWECHPHSTTPIALFMSLLADNYKPLMDFLSGSKGHHFFHIQALLIFISDNSDSQFQNSDCIYHAMNLAQSRLATQQKMLKYLEPKIKGYFNKTRMRKEQAAAQKNQTNRNVYTAYLQCIESGKPYNQGTIAFTYKKMFGKTISLSSVSRHLKQSGISKYKKELHD